MLDFMFVSEKVNTKKGIIEIYPTFKVQPSKDLMIRGGDFYAIWDVEAGRWSTDIFDAVRLIDNEIDIYTNKRKSEGISETIISCNLWNTDNGQMAKFHNYCKKLMPDHWNPLDTKIIFANDEVKQTDYSSKRLAYPLKSGSIEYYDKLMSTLYSEEERHKIEWAIGSIVNGDSRKIQKFIVLYGAAGTGKSTVLDIVLQLFDGYCAAFDAKALGSHNNSFALESFKGNPLVAVQHDGDLSRIEDNTMLNSLVSHEKMTVNEKFKSVYEQAFKAFLFMGTNKPVKITDAKSGLLRRLIDVRPTGNTLPNDIYNECLEGVKFELGAIAYHCKEVYEADKRYYNSYIPTLMLGASNDFYNFVIDSYDIFNTPDFITLKQAWLMYKEYCEEARVPYPYSKRPFSEELKNYFNEFHLKATLEDGTKAVNCYKGFKLAEAGKTTELKKEKGYSINLNQDASLFDKIFADCTAQYARINDQGNEQPSYKWANVTSTLRDLETWKTHYVKVPENLIVIDFDLKNEKGEKDLDKNLKAASKFPPTYTELSKSGYGIHLHYYYDGNVEELDPNYAENIEVKIFKANSGSALRRRLSLCNDIPIATLSSGLPIKQRKGDKMVTSDRIRSERGLRALIDRCLNKDIHGYTKPEMDFIKKILDDAYESDLKYDVSDLRNDIINFALGSSNHSEYCLRLVDELKFTSEVDDTDNKETITDSYMSRPIIFFDCEVFPNLFLINWKEQGEGKPIHRMINPSAHEVQELEDSGRLVGFNCRGYDNHMLHGCELGYSNAQLFDLSQRLTSQDKKIQKNAKFATAYAKSYTDIFDYAVKRQSLKKWEIDLGIHHMELGLPWDEPVPEEKWIKVAEYCDNDVISTEAVWDATQSDFKTRQMLADLAGMTVNDSTNSLIEHIVFGNNKHPQSEFNYRKMWEKPNGKYFTWKDAFDYAIGNREDKPEGKVWFQGYKFWFEEKSGKKIPHSSYRDVEDVGEGGYVYSEPGIWYKIKTQDVSGEHPASIRVENLFGRYTLVYGDIVDARLAIKHKDFESARTMLDGKLNPYLDDPGEAKALATALKLVVNRVYGQTFTSYDNPFKDPKNIDNIVAKRGSLFMIDLRNAVQDLGFKVVHCKTDSIKVPNITPELITFIRKFGECYGYSLETEEEYERFCLVNKAVYIAKTEEGKWTATGTEFQVPYIFKTLFTKEPIEFNDLCETKSVDRGGAIYLDMNEDLPDVSFEERELKELRSIRNAWEKAKIDGDDEKLLKKVKAFDNKYGTQLVDECSVTGADVNDILCRTMEKVNDRAANGHNYNFVGKVGQFCPIKAGHGGGELVRKDDKGLYSAVTGTSGYRWLESEMVKNLGKEDSIDISYYEVMAEEAKKDIYMFGDFKTFVEGPLPKEPEFKTGFVDGVTMPYPVYRDYVEL